MAEPKIYTKSYLSEDDTVTVTHGSGSFANVYDRDYDSKWLTSGAASDATTVTITIIFKEGSVTINRTIDRLILLNHNWENFVVYYWDGSTYQTWLSVTGNATADTVHTLTSQTISEMKIEITNTIITNAEKFAGEIIPCALQLDIGQDMSLYEVVYSKNAIATRMGDGGVQQQVKRFSANRFEKYEAAVAFDFISSSVLASLETIKKTGKPFLWQPEYTARPKEIYLVTWVDSFRYRYVSMYKTAGFHVEFSLAEV
jgi:hypothetical protein